jgi:ribosomal protein S18 acetylase RimI-like enzyme
MAREFEPAIFQGGDIQIELQHPAALQPEDWLHVQDLRRSAFTSAFPNRTSEEINRFVPRQSPELYGERVVNPALAITEGNSFANPLVGRAFYTPGRHPGTEVQVSNAFKIANREPKPPRMLVGYIALADNTSGRLEAVRKAKMRMEDKRYAWISCIAIDPRFQGAGIATEVVHEVFKSGHYKERQPVSAYTFTESHYGTHFVKDILGLIHRKDHDTGKPLAPEPKYIFGEDNRRALQVAWNHRTVRDVRNGVARRRMRVQHENHGQAMGRTVQQADAILAERAKANEPSE